MCGLRRDGFSGQNRPAVQKCRLGNSIVALDGRHRRRQRVRAKKHVDQGFDVALTECLAPTRDDLRQVLHH